MCIRDSPIVLVIPVNVIAVVIAIIGVAARTLVRSRSPVIVVGAIVVWVVPVIRLVTLIVIRLVSPILIALYIPVCVILIVILGVVIRWVVVRRILILTPSVVPKVDHSIPFILAVILVILQQARHSLDSFYLALSPGFLDRILIMVS